MTGRRMVAGTMAAVMALHAPLAAGAPRVKYEKTEVEKARGKCVLAVLGGALVGGAIGTIAGRHGTGIGAGIGAAAGAGLCAIIMANAKQADRIIAAQIAAAQYQDRPYSTTFAADDGTSSTTLTARAGPSQPIEGARLRPVRYALLDGSKAESPIPPADSMRDCRAVSATIGTTGAAYTALPTQYVCRMDNGDWRPYNLTTAQVESLKKAA